jgi:HSP20 family protein
MIRESALCDDLPMRSRYAGMLPSEVAEFADEIRRAFVDIGRTLDAESLVGQCSPAIDFYEREESFEIIVDLPGIEPSAVRVLARGDTVLIVGEKSARPLRPASLFHLVERDFGRFARAIRIGRPCNPPGARARFSRGELRISVPKVTERRGHIVAIPIVDASLT